MRVAEILEIEKTNFENIYLFKEGFFWRVYEKSAWRFLKNIREYRVFRKYVKAVKQDIVYLGFPETILQEILSDVETRYAVSHIIRKTDTSIEIQGFPEMSGFELWKDEWTIANIKPASPIVSENPNMHNEIIRKIKEYPIISKTPVEAFNFLAELQKQLYELYKL